MSQTIHIQYFALLREQRGESVEKIQSTAQTARELYTQLQAQYHFTLSTDLIRVAINNQFVPWDTALNSGDSIVFIPPVAGG